jgi:exodeoxyribonuclease VII small subunit
MRPITEAVKHIMDSTNTMQDMSFEDALARLEAIVEELEGGDLPLEDALRKFEEGMALRAVCTQKLQEAEAKVEEWKATTGETQ